eukprot:11203641-Lingulodinium_polyedra.AAC.1
MTKTTLRLCQWARGCGNGWDDNSDGDGDGDGDALLCCWRVKSTHNPRIPYLWKTASLPNPH